MPHCGSQPIQQRLQWHMQAGSTQCFFGVTVVLLLVGAMGADNATLATWVCLSPSSNWIRNGGTPRLLQYLTVLLRSDGSAIACGENFFRQCNIPILEEGLSYTQVSAGDSHTVLLRSDGSVVACGDNGCGQGNVPFLEPGVSCVSNMSLERALAVQLHFDSSGGAFTLVCSSLAGEEQVRLNVQGSDLAWETRKQLAVELKTSLQSVTQSSKPRRLT
eukprot:Skav221477  [mRNA]  locus=scaffold2365:24844:25497:- [translate_table: standard]